MRQNPSTNVYTGYNIARE